MKSHQASKQPDWEKVDPQDRNLWQRVAAKTRGFVTPGNVVTLISAGLSVSGINDVRRGNKVRGAVKLILGGLGDRADGTVADITGTKSPLGEALDAGTDKLLLAYGMGALAVDGIIPKTSALLIVAQNAANTGFAAMAKRRERAIHPGWTGKCAMGLQRAVPVLHVLESVAEDHNWDTTSHWLGRAANDVTATSLGLGVTAAAQYAYETFGPLPEVEDLLIQAGFRPDVNTTTGRSGASWLNIVAHRE